MIDRVSHPTKALEGEVAEATEAIEHAGRRHKA